MPPIIEVQHLFKRFNDLTAVDGISFTVAPGEFFGLLGPNGAGKTTTIRMLYGFSPPTRGIIRVFEMDISRDWRKIKARIGLPAGQHAGPGLDRRTEPAGFCRLFFHPGPAGPKSGKRAARLLCAFQPPQ